MRVLRRWAALAREKAGVQHAMRCVLNPAFCFRHVKAEPAPLFILDFCSCVYAAVTDASLDTLTENAAASFWHYEKEEPIPDQSKYFSVSCN